MNHPEHLLQPIIHAIQNKLNVILIGCGGAGKTLTIRYLTQYFHRKGKIVGITASTGIAAINLSIEAVKGRTLHSWAGVGFATDPIDKLIANIIKFRLSPDRALKHPFDRWMKTDILIVDEISMIGKAFLEKLDVIGRVIRKKDVPFGGITLIFSGDPMQLPPVNDEWFFRYDKWDEFGALPFIFKSPLRFTRRDEKGNYTTDTSYFDILLRAREGTITREDCQLLTNRVQAYHEYMRTEKELEFDLQQELKSVDKNIEMHREGIIKPTILYSLKINVAAHNKQELDKLKGDAVKIIAQDNYSELSKYKKFSSQQLKDKYEKYLDDLIPKELEFKVGAQVMLKYNLNTDAGLVNGSRGVITDIYDNEDDAASTIVEVKFLNGEIVELNKIVFKYEDDQVLAMRSQFPLMLAWSLTVHSSQGCTLDYAICDLGPQIFAFGQAYVALSRVRNLSGLFISAFHDKSIKADPEALARLKEWEAQGVEIKIPSSLVNRLLVN